LWRLKAREDGRLRTTRPGTKTGAQARATRAQAVEAWMQIGRAMALSGDPADRGLARAIDSFVKDVSVFRRPVEPSRASEQGAQRQPIDLTPGR
jgi:hypothetical protein